MSYLDLHQWGNLRDEQFYLTALTYGQVLWQKGYTARAILALARGLYADLPSKCAVLGCWPLPYLAITWMVREHPDDGFLGNPKISFQHQAARIRGERALIKSARAWATWYLISTIRHDLPDDPAIPTSRQNEAFILGALRKHGLTGESETWKTALDWAESHPLLQPGKALQIS